MESDGRHDERTYGYSYFWGQANVSYDSPRRFSAESEPPSLSSSQATSRTAVGDVDADLPATPHAYGDGSSNDRDAASLDYGAANDGRTTPPYDGSYYGENLPPQQPYNYGPRPFFYPYHHGYSGYWYNGCAASTWRDEAQSTAAASVQPYHGHVPSSIPCAWLPPGSSDYMRGHYPYYPPHPLDASQSQPFYEGSHYWWYPPPTQAASADASVSMEGPSAPVPPPQRSPPPGSAETTTQRPPRRPTACDSNETSPRVEAAFKLWLRRFEELKKYREEHGHCNVPQHYAANRSLGKWVNKQRMEKKYLDSGFRSSMTEHKIRALEEIGFQWAKSRPSWDERYEELKAFFAEHKHSDVPTRNLSNRSLGRWVTSQRSQYKKMMEGHETRLTAERIAKLEDIGFKWSMMDREDK